MQVSSKLNAEYPQSKAPTFEEIVDSNFEKLGKSKQKDATVFEAVKEIIS